MHELWMMMNAFIPFLFFFGFWFLIGKDRGKFCPGCGKSFSQFQSPFTKTRRQWLVGGYRCLGCGCETDLTGKKVHASALPDQQFVIMGLGALLLVMLAFLVFSCLPLLMILNRG